MSDHEGLQDSEIRDISAERQLAYYGGGLLIIVGFLLFVSNFFVANKVMAPMGSVGGPQIDFNDPAKLIQYASEGQHGGLGRQSFIGRAVGGMLLMILGSVIAGIGKHGAAGSGLVLSPRKARKDMEPWSRMSGGMLKDTLDEAGLDLSKVSNALAQNSREEMSFDDKLRRLHQLYGDGILTKEEYDREKKEILDDE